MHSKEHNASSNLALKWLFHSLGIVLEKRVERNQVNVMYMTSIYTMSNEMLPFNVNFITVWDAGLATVTCIESQSIPLFPWRPRNPQPLRIRRPRRWSPMGSRRYRTLLQYTGHTLTG